ncbi:hypothetical protein [Hyphomicrobium sp.]|uniref:hypothetical protein n=1 Tax=Hyphomicrobium sp. TaxID=82 RepID=UPI0025BA9557|nr:hypothetical protein [Hyphomicrobium sp.]MCC7252814.1 hypothetical protein [Hyphomicrobium sp.]
MIRDEQIEAAVAQGILTAEQARRLRAFADGSPTGAAPDDTAADADDEKFRLIGGFNDVFVTIGVALLVAALFALASVFELRPGFAVLAMISAWGLSEVFSRRMRLALPSVALAVMFAGGAAFAAASLADLTWPNLSFLFAALGAALGAIAHERRFRVPINWAIAAVGLVYAVADGVSLAAPGWMEHNRPALFAALGLGVFLAALRVDASDIARRTRRSDIAFWLHLVAAPMIVHGAIPLLVGTPDGMGTGQALAVLGIFVLLGLIAVTIDRRALLVSGLIYAGVAIGYLLSQSVEKDLGASLTLLGLATLVLSLSAGWRSLRRVLLPLLPLGPLRQLVPPPT